MAARSPPQKWPAIQRASGSACEACQPRIGVRPAVERRKGPDWPAVLIGAFPERVGTEEFEGARQSLTERCSLEAGPGPRTLEYVSAQRSISALRSSWRSRAASSPPPRLASFPHQELVRNLNKGLRHHVTRCRMSHTWTGVHARPACGFFIACARPGLNPRQTFARQRQCDQSAEAALGR
jgi:hypothetical protein